MNIAAVCAHPDDIEYFCGGTMIRYIQKGHKVSFITVTNGEVGSPNLDKKEIAEIRYKEAKKAAEIIGAELIWLGFPDEFLFDSKETRISVLNALRKVKADVIFTHYQDYYNCDHNAVSKITNDVGILLNVKNIPTEYPPLKKNPYLYFLDTAAGIGFEPEEYVDITEVFEKKKKALLTHESQFTWLDNHSNVDLIDMMEIQARFRGYQCGVRYAEAFKGVKTWPRGIEKSLLPQYL